MNSGNTNGLKILLTPAGAGIAMMSFFLPWIRISCLGKSSYAGYQFGGIFWIVFAMAALILIAYLALKQVNRLALLRSVVVCCVTIAAAVVVYGCFSVAGGKKILLFRLGPDDVHLRLHIGAYGTIVGFLLALYGSVPVKLRRLRRRSNKAAESVSS